MKKIIVSGLVVALLVVAFLLWQHLQRSKLTGTWDLTLGPDIHSTSTVNPDGSYVCQITGLPDGKVIKFAGTMKIKDGFLINTITNDSQLGGHVPRVTHEQIVRMDDHNLVVKDDKGSEFTFRKLEK